MPGKHKGGKKRPMRGTGGTRRGGKRKGGKK